MNNNIIKEGMDALGFKRFVSEEHDGHIITSFHFPNHPNFSFKVFYDKLSQKGMKSEKICAVIDVENSNCE